MSDDRSTPDRGQSLALIPIGEFGAAVADRISRLMPVSSVMAGADDPLLATGVPVVLASWRESRTAASALDSSSAVPWWLPVVYEHPVIRVGPVFGDGLPGCFDCFSTRMTSVESSRTESLWDVYDAEQSSGVAGYLEHHTAIAASLACALIPAKREPVRAVHVYHVLTGQLESHNFVPLSNCSRWPATITSGGASK